jgi:hypothetical protein
MEIKGNNLFVIRIPIPFSYACPESFANPLDELRIYYNEGE